MPLKFMHRHHRIAATWQLQPDQINTLTITHAAAVDTPTVRSWGLRKFAVVSATAAGYVPYLTPADNVTLMFGRTNTAGKATLAHLQADFPCINTLLNQTSAAQTPYEFALVELLQALSANVKYIVINDILPQLSVCERQSWLKILMLVAQTSPATVILLTQTPLVDTNQITAH